MCFFFFGRGGGGCVTHSKILRYLLWKKWHLKKWCIFFRCFFGILSNESINKSMNHICSNVMECLPIHSPNNLNQPDIGNYSSSIGAWWKIPTKQTTMISENISFKEITVQQPAVFFFRKDQGFIVNFTHTFPSWRVTWRRCRDWEMFWGRCFFGCSRKAGIYLKSIWIIE